LSNLNVMSTTAMEFQKKLIGGNNAAWIKTCNC
jgi:hypothetical protein